MFIISFCLLADASILIFNPSLYRKSLDFINETIGPVWNVFYGLLFLFCAIFIFVSIIFSRITFLFIPAGIIMAWAGLFFLLSETQSFGYLTNVWTSLSNKQYRLAGVLFVILAIIVCYAAAISH